WRGISSVPTRPRRWPVSGQDDARGRSWDRRRQERGQAGTPPRQTIGVPARRTRWALRCAPRPPIASTPDR
ncbi:MAG: hypothetical protein AVDCRST_MAG19-3080, partial [uncultured Thermomicrobiales bacterium]